MTSGIAKFELRLVMQDGAFYVFGGVCDVKNYFKGLITGVIICAVVCAIPAMADTIDVIFNQVRINVDGLDKIQWDENIDLGDGEEAPSSIMYKGTTYLPMRKLANLMGKDVRWNGDSNTVSVTGRRQKQEVIAQKPDKNGNLWKYYTFEVYNEGSYLGIEDEERGYERVYKLGSNVYAADDGVYFFKPIKQYETAVFMKIAYDSDENTQDGEELFKTGLGFERFSHARIIDDEYVYVSYNRKSNGATTKHSILNYKKNGIGSSFYAGTAGNGSTGYVYDIQNNENEIIVKYEINQYSNHGPCYEIIFDKAANAFGKPVEIEKRVIEETN